MEPRFAWSIGTVRRYISWELDFVCLTTRHFPMRVLRLVKFQANGFRIDSLCVLVTAVWVNCPRHWKCILVRDLCDIMGETLVQMTLLMVVVLRPTPWECHAVELKMKVVISVLQRVCENGDTVKCDGSCILEKL
jgi:hypothetical protein